MARNVASLRARHQLKLARVHESKDTMTNIEPLLQYRKTKGIEVSLLDSMKARKKIIGFTLTKMESLVDPRMLWIQVTKISENPNLLSTLVRKV